MQTDRYWAKGGGERIIRSNFGEREREQNDRYRENEKENTKRHR